VGDYWHSSRAGACIASAQRCLRSHASAVPVSTDCGLQGLRKRGGCGELFVSCVSGGSHTL